MTDNFQGDNAKLVECINALLELDASGNLVPHGIGGSARPLLEASASRLAALAQQAGALSKVVAQVTDDGCMQFDPSLFVDGRWAPGLKLCIASSGPGGGGEGA